MQQTHIMLDIETYGTAPGSAINSIGAVRFNEGKIIERFYRRIDPESCIRAGLTIDPVTVKWWLCQSDEARKEMTLPGEELESVLKGFVLFADASPDTLIWGNGAGFDNVLVRCACESAGVSPWVYGKNRCYRTMKNAYPEIPFTDFAKGIKHNALDDAESQALHLMAIWKLQDRQKKALTYLRQNSESLVPDSGALKAILE